MSNWTQDDFSGGMRRSASKYAPNELARLVGAWCHRGDLEMMPKPAAIAFDKLFTNDRDEDIIYSVAPYVNGAGLTCLVARRATSLWIGIPEIDYPRYQDAFGTLNGVGSWDMNDRTNDIFDRLMNSNEFVLYNHGTIPLRLWSSYVRDFDGSAYLKADPSYYTLWQVGSVSRCWEAWIRCTGPKGVPYTIISTKSPTPLLYPGYIFSIDTNGHLYAEICQDKDTNKWAAATGNTDLCDARWHHVAFIYDGSHYPLLYVDGNAETPTNTGVEGAWNSDNIYELAVGYTYTSANNHSRFIGQMGTLSGWTGVPTADFLALHATLEAPRYGVALPVSYSWYPLHGGSHAGESTTFAPFTYLRERSSICGESFQQIEANLFCASDAPSALDYLLVWRGNLLHCGRIFYADCDNGGHYYLWEGSEAAATIYAWRGYAGYTDILPGDTLYIKDHSTTPAEWRLHGHVIKWARTDEIVTHDAGWDTTGKGPEGSDYCEYCIVRLHRPGVEAASACAAVKNDVTVGTWAGTESVIYLWRYRNSRTGYLGRFSSPSAAVTPTAGKSLDVSGWVAAPADQAVDGIQIYRQTNGGTFYLVYEEDLIEFEDPVPPAGTKYWHRNLIDLTWNDTNVANGAQLTDQTIGYYDRPGALAHIGYYDHQLWAVRDNKIWKSALDPFYEYWVDQDCLIPALPAAENQAGTFLVGASVTDPIKGWIVEGGSFGLTGESGSNILAFTATRAYRIYGHSRSTFVLASGPGIGSINHRSLANVGGVVILCDGDKFYRLATGSNEPEEISDVLWPYGMRVAGITDEMAEQIAAGSWNGFYIFSADLSAAGESDLTFCYHVARRSWTAYAHRFRGFAVWDKPGDAAAKVITGASDDSVSYTGGIAELWPVGGTLGSLDALTRPILPSDVGENNLLNVRQIDRFYMVSQKPLLADVTLLMTPYREGDTVNAAATPSSMVIEHEDAATGTRVISKLGQPATSGWYLQMAIATTNQRLLRIEGLQAEVTTRGKA